MHPEDDHVVQIVDQRHLPHRLVTANLESYHQAATAIREMWVRGAPLIGATAAYGCYLAALQAPKNDVTPYLNNAFATLLDTRPTAVNLSWAIDRMRKALLEITSKEDMIILSKAIAQDIVEEDVRICRDIGIHGLALIESIRLKKEGVPINILTHCNAGRMATVEWGTATSPIYRAHQQGIPVHIWVDETRPRNQGARITAWELAQAKIPHTIIVDNAGGLLMQQGKVDLCLVGTDRTALNGDVGNKIGTYLKALAARDNSIPFYVAVPSHSFDWNAVSGSNIPIEERSPEEVTFISGLRDEQMCEVRLAPPGSAALNYGFDITPARLVTGLITERGICKASEKGIRSLFPDGPVCPI